MYILVVNKSSYPRKKQVCIAKCAILNLKLSNNSFVLLATTDFPILFANSQHDQKANRFLRIIRNLIRPHRSISM